MDIRTKLALTMVTFSLSSMFVLGAFSYRVSADLLQEISERQLDALAESKRQDMQQVIDGWRNHVRLIRSRTRLRMDLRDYQQNRDAEVLADMQRIADDAQTSTAHVERIAVFDRDAILVVAAGEATKSPEPAGKLDRDEVAYSGFYLDDDGRPNFVFRSLVYLDEALIGSIEVVIDAHNLQDLAGNYRGLGETGETLIVGEEPDGDVVLLHNPRHTDEALAWKIAPDFVRAAVDGREAVFTDGIRDYRGKEVWASTRYLPDVDCGLVVKVDADEETRRARRLRESMIDLGLALGAFAVVGGTLLGFYLARPIRDLVQVVRQVRAGDDSVRADASKDDEIGLLAHTLNDYLDHRYRQDEDDERS